MRGYILASAIVIAWHSAAGVAAEKGLIEEIIVTAQRVEEDAQKVPMGLTAFTDALIEDRQIIGILDVQMNAPNVGATEANFGDRAGDVHGMMRRLVLQISKVTRLPSKRPPPFTPSDEQMILMPDVSGNRINGLSEDAVRRPSPVYWHHHTMGTFIS